MKVKIILVSVLMLIVGSISCSAAVKINPRSSCRNIMESGEHF